MRSARRWCTNKARAACSARYWRCRTNEARAAHTARRLRRRCRGGLTALYLRKRPIQFGTDQTWDEIRHLTTPTSSSAHIQTYRRLLSAKRPSMAYTLRGGIFLRAGPQPSCQWWTRFPSRRIRDLANAAAVKGNIMLLCIRNPQSRLVPFWEKVKRASAAGAAAVIIVNTDDVLMRMGRQRKWLHLRHPSADDQIQ